jgi:hypothetical protein
LGPIQQEGNDLATTQQAEQQVAAESGTAGQDQTCTDADGVGTDADTVSSDADGVSSDADGVEGSLNQLRSDICALQADYSQLQNDQSKLPGYVPPGTPDQSDVSSALSTANNAVQSAISTTNGYIGEANSDVSTVTQYEDQAVQTGNCGSAPSASSPIQNIS